MEFKLKRIKEKIEYTQENEWSDYKTVEGNIETIVGKKKSSLVIIFNTYEDAYTILNKDVAGVQKQIDVLKSGLDKLVLNDGDMNVFKNYGEYIEESLKKGSGKKKLPSRYKELDKLAGTWIAKKQKTKELEFQQKQMDKLQDQMKALKKLK